MDFLDRRAGRGEGFVDFVAVELGEPAARTVERSAGGADRLVEHDHRVAAGNRQMVDARDRGQAVLLQRPLTTNQHARSAVANLAGVAGMMTRRAMS